MKILFTVFLLIIANFTNAQSEIDHYIKIDNRIIDVRTGKVLKENFPSSTQIRLANSGFRASLKVGNGYKITKLNDALKEEWSLKFDGELSPDWNYFIYVLDGDLYRKDISWDNGKIINDQRITELGVFRRNFDYEIWNDDYLLFFYNQKGYRINLRDNSLSNTILPYSGIYARRHLSPSSTFSLVKGRIYDIENNININNRTSNTSPANDNFILDTKPANTSIDRFVRWIDDQQYFVLHRMNNKYTIAKYSINDVYNPLSEVTIDISNIRIVGNETGIYSNGSSSYSETHKRNTHISDYSDYILITQKEGRDYSSLLLLSLLDGSTTEITNNITNFSLGAGVVAVRVDENRILYSSTGDLITQGTYLYNISSSTSKKISSFAADKILNLAGTDYSVITANEKVYVYNLSSEIFKEFDLLSSRYRDLSTFVNYSYFNSSN